MAVEWRTRTLKYYPADDRYDQRYCFGGAFSIVEGCDLAIASETATFGLSEINFKLFLRQVSSRWLTSVRAMRFGTGCWAVHSTARSPRRSG